MPKKSTYEELEKQIQELEQTESELKTADKALRESEERFRTVVNHSPTKIHIKDLEGRYLLVNKEAEDLFRRASQLYPGYLTARRNLARLLETQGRPAEALAVYRELAEFESDNESLKRKIAKLRRLGSPV